MRAAYIACICILVAVAHADPLTRGLSRRFLITETEAQQCISKTNATAEDLTEVDFEIPHPHFDMLQKESTRRGLCAMTCAMQAAGMMIDATLQLTKLHEYADHGSKMEPEVGIKVHRSIDVCYTATKESPDACEVFLNLFSCLLKHSTPVGV